MILSFPESRSISIVPLSICFSLGGTGYAEYSFTVSTPPCCGQCEVNPKEGEAIDTTFSIECSGWKSQSSAMQYQFSTVSSAYPTLDGSQNKASEAKTLTLISFGILPKTSVILPEGPSVNNFIQNLLVRVIDSYGSSVEVNLTVKVSQAQYSCHFTCYLHIILGVFYCILLSFNLK